jgi:short-subunit dehydrogenase
MAKVLVLGATSAIAQEVARIFAREGAELFLAARSPEKLEAVCNDLKARGASKVDCMQLDLADISKHRELFDRAIESLQGLDFALLAYGTLGNQKECEQNFEVALKEINNNYTSAVSLLTLLANYFEPKKRGVIAAISSVAGDRGRQSNYVYGSTKAGLTAFMSGMRNRLARSGVTVLTIKPGPVDTPMTITHRKTLLFGKADKVGMDIYEAIVKRRDVLYTPWFWRYIMLVVKHVPEPVFKKLNLT